MNIKRSRILKNAIPGKGAVIYWMSREQRTCDNWALLYAQQIAIKNNKPLIVIFNIVPEFLNSSFRNYKFMLQGLQEIETLLINKNIPFIVLTGRPEITITEAIVKYSAHCLVTDFDPLKIKIAWINSVINKVDVPVYEVDAHNIVPCWLASSKKEYGAYTLRPKINKLLFEFLENYPELQKHPITIPENIFSNNWESVHLSIQEYEPYGEIKWILPGEKAALNNLFNFMKNRLDQYSSDKNNPLKNSVSNLSPYLHFGHISSQRIAWEIENSTAIKDSKLSFLEELIIRKELSDNFCYYEKNYDNFEAFPDWAKKTLSEHKQDNREYIYTQEEFEFAKTHDNLWNAAQSEMTIKGKMHGYMRMYWAKKILEWSKTPEEAQQIAIYLNDKYELDGRDPNGYTGIAWSIGGVHDRAWQERPVFGKIRFMSYNGCKSKFNINDYIAQNK